MKTTTYFAGAAALALSACASPTPPTITAADVTRINAEADRFAVLPDTAMADLPSTSVSYVGHAGGRVSGDADGAFIGDMTMNVDFATNTIGGTIDNINLIDDDDVPEQLLGGDLTISGTEVDGLISANATGRLSAVGEESVRGSADVTLGLLGDVVTDTQAGDSVYGAVSGSGSGDFDISIRGGEFFGAAQ